MKAPGVPPAGGRPASVALLLTLKKKFLMGASSMSLLVLLLTARPGAGTGGAEAPPPCQRVHGAVLRPSDRRHRCGEPGAAREDAMLHGENQDRVKPPQSGAEPPLGDERPQKRPDDRATRAACGAQSPGPLAAATEERARPTSSLSRGLARLPTSQYYRCVDWRVRNMLGPSAQRNIDP